MPGGRSLAQSQGGGLSPQSKCRTSMLIGFLPMQHRYSLLQAKKAAGPWQEQACNFSSEPAMLARLGSRRPCLDDPTSTRTATFSAGVRVTSNHAAHLTTTTVNRTLHQEECVACKPRRTSRNELSSCVSAPSWRPYRTSLRTSSGMSSFVAVARCLAPSKCFATMEPPSLSLKSAMLRTVSCGPREC